MAKVDTTQKRVVATITNGSGTSRLDSLIIDTASQQAIEAVNQALAEVEKLNISVDPTADSLARRTTYGEVLTAEPTCCSSAISRQYLEVFITALLERLNLGGHHCCGDAVKLRYDGDGNVVTDIGYAKDDSTTLVITFGKTVSDDDLQQGVYRIVQTKAELEELAETDLADGTKVYVIEEDKEYRWLNNEWIVVASMPTLLPVEGVIYGLTSDGWVEISTKLSSVEELQEKYTELETRVEQVEAGNIELNAASSTTIGGILSTELTVEDGTDYYVSVGEDGTAKVTVAKPTAEELLEILNSSSGLVLDGGTAST